MHVWRYRHTQRALSKVWSLDGIGQAQEQREIQGDHDRITRLTEITGRVTRVFFREAHKGSLPYV
jgi:hypothetical protein